MSEKQKASYKREAKKRNLKIEVERIIKHYSERQDKLRAEAIFCVNHGFLEQDRWIRQELNGMNLLLHELRQAIQ